MIAFFRNLFKCKGNHMADFTPLTAIIVELASKVDAEVAKRVAAETALAAAQAAAATPPPPVVDEQPSVDAAVQAVTAIIAKIPA